MSSSSARRSGCFPCRATARRSRRRSTGSTATCPSTPTSCGSRRHSTASRTSRDRPGLRRSRRVQRRQADARRRHRVPGAASSATRSLWQMTPPHPSSRPGRSLSTRVLRPRRAPARQRHSGHRRDQRITATGVVDRDREQHEADVIVYATGFHATEYLFPMAITGRDGVTIERPGPRMAPAPTSAA